MTDSYIITPADIRKLRRKSHEAPRGSGDTDRLFALWQLLRKRGWSFDNKQLPRSVIRAIFDPAKGEASPAQGAGA